jgi:hypothetical protein
MYLLFVLQNNRKIKMKKIKTCNQCKIATVTGPGQYLEIINLARQHYANKQNPLDRNDFQRSRQW